MLEAIELCREASNLEPTSVVALSWWRAVDSSILAELFPDGFVGWYAEHADMTETALMMYLQPDTVRAMDLTNETPPRSGVYVHPFDEARYTCQDVLSHTRGASAEVGRRFSTPSRKSLRAWRELIWMKWRGYNEW